MEYTCRKFNRVDLFIHGQKMTAERLRNMEFEIYNLFFVVVFHTGSLV